MAIVKAVNFRFGDIVQLEAIGASDVRYRVQLVGVLPGLSLMVTAPDIRGQHIPLNEGAAFTVRIFNGDDALAFDTTVVRYCREPYPYLHLAYPEKMERAQARNARRTRLKLPAQVHLVSGDRTGVPGNDRVGPPRLALIRDLSTAGAQLETESDLGPVDAKIVITVTLAFDRIAGRPVVLPAKVRNVKQLVAENGVATRYYGVQFVELPPEADLALSAFVYRHLAAQLLQEPVEA